MVDKNLRIKRFVKNVNTDYVYVLHEYIMVDDVARVQHGNPRGPSI